MPYLQLDLEAKHRIPKVARALGFSEGVVAWGLLELWDYCLREKVRHIRTAQLPGFFGGDAGGVATALSAFDFLEQEEGTSWRVRGLSRYSRAQEARSKGGKAAIGNLVQFTRLKPAENPKQAENDQKSPAAPGESAGNQPDISSGSTPALYPRSEIRDPKLLKHIAGTKRPRRERKIDQAAKELVDRMRDAFLEVRGVPLVLATDGAFWAAYSCVLRLRKQATDETILLLWRNSAASTDKWLRCNSIPAFGAKFNDLLDAERQRRGTA